MKVPGGEGQQRECQSTAPVRSGMNVPGGRAAPQAPIGTCNRSYMHKLVSMLVLHMPAAGGGMRDGLYALTFLLFLICTRITPGTGFMPSFCMALRLFFSERLCLPRAPPSSPAAAQRGGAGAGQRAPATPNCANRHPGSLSRSNRAAKDPPPSSRSGTSSSSLLTSSSTSSSTSCRTGSPVREPPRPATCHAAPQGHHPPPPSRWPRPLPWSWFNLASSDCSPVQRGRSAHKPAPMSHTWDHWA